MKFSLKTKRILPNKPQSQRGFTFKEVDETLTLMDKYEAWQKNGGKVVSFKQYIEQKELPTATTKPAEPKKSETPDDIMAAYDFMLEGDKA